MISDSYIQQLQALHADGKRRQGFGGKIKKLGKFTSYMEEWKPSSLLDYGCGKGTILQHLKNTYPDTNITDYDPAVSYFADMPEGKFDVVFSNDVLEHIEPEFVNDVLKHIDSLAEKYIWLRIDSMPARKILADGRNAHLIQKGENWWLRKINQFVSGQVIYYETTNKGKVDIAIRK